MKIRKSCAFFAYSYRQLCTEGRAHRVGHTHTPEEEISLKFAQNDRYLSVICTQILNMVKNQRGDPWKSKIFLLWGVYERGWRGVRSLLKPSFAFLFNKKLKFQNLSTDNRQVPNDLTFKFCSPAASVGAIGD